MQQLKQEKVEDKLGFRRLFPYSSIISLLFQIILVLYFIGTVPFLGPEEQHVLKIALYWRLICFWGKVSSHESLCSHEELRDGPFISKKMGWSFVVVFFVCLFVLINTICFLTLKVFARDFSKSASYFCVFLVRIEKLSLTWSLIAVSVLHGRKWQQVEEQLKFCKKD